MLKFAIRADRYLRTYGRTYPNYRKASFLKRITTSLSSEDFKCKNKNSKANGERSIKDRQI